MSQKTTDREKAFRDLGMDDPSKGMIDGAKKVGDGAAEAGNLIEDVATPNPLAKVGVASVIGIKLVKAAGTASEKIAKDIAKRIEKDLGKDARRAFHDSKVNGAGDRTTSELKEDARALYQNAGVEIPKWLE